LLSCCALLLAALAPGQVPAVAELELTDQYGRADSLSAHREQVTVVFVVTARRLRNIKAWESGLRERFEDAVELVRIADVPDSDPPPTHDRVAAKLRKRVPPEVPILIDIERHFARGMELDTDRPNLLIFDARGRFAAGFHGRHDPELFEQVCDAIEAARESRS
jgi:hypothetical protein